MLLVVSVVLEGIASALVSPMTESLLALSMESAERARVSAMVYVALIVLISPFGWIAGQLSALDRSLPFALNMALFAIGLVLVWVIGKPGFLSPSHSRAEPGLTAYPEGDRESSSARAADHEKSLEPQPDPSRAS
jgi:MFS family permease